MALHGGSDLTRSLSPRTLSVSGTIKFQDVRAARNVTLHIRVEDTKYADASATTVAERVIEGVDIAPGAMDIPFTVDGIPENPGARYTVRVHADVDRDGRVSQGDYVSTRSNPIDLSGKTVSNILMRKVG